MKKLISFFAVAALIIAFSACDNKKESLAAMTLSDSLQHVLDLRDAEINDLLSTFNDIQQGFNEINEAEGRINLAKSGEKGDKNTMREDLQFIKDKMTQNRQMIENLQQQLRESNFKGDELKRTLNGLIAQLEEKNKQLAALQAEIEAKDVTIAEQGQKITEQETAISDLNQNVSSLNTQVDEQKAENTRKQETINTQDAQLHTAYYAYGTKSELKAQNILIKGKVLQGNYNKSYFKQIDIRTEKVIKLNSKSAELLTNHPNGSYTLDKDMNNQYVLRISDPQKFWSASKYLVVRVK